MASGSHRSFFNTRFTALNIIFLDDYLQIIYHLNSLMLMIKTRKWNSLKNNSHHIKIILINVDEHSQLFSNVSVVPCSIFFSCMQLLLFPLVQSFHMLVQTHTLEEIPFPISLFPVLNFCELQALGSGHRPKYLCTCHGNTCCFCFVVRGGLFWPCQVLLQELLCLIPWHIEFSVCQDLTATATTWQNVTLCRRKINRGVRFSEGVYNNSQSSARLYSNLLIVRRQLLPR